MTSRSKYLLFAFLVVVAGLFARKVSFLFPDFVNLYLGDALYALMVYFGIRFLTVRFTFWVSGLFALLFCFAIEFAQLSTLPILVTMRSTTLGALVLGRGFLWSDLLAYIVGVSVGLLFDFRSKGF